MARGCPYDVDSGFRRNDVGIGGMTCLCWNDVGVAGMTYGFPHSWGKCPKDKGGCKGFWVLPFDAALV